MAAKFFIVAGEESGERYGASLMKAMQKQMPDVTFHGIGGERMQAAGLKTFRHCKELVAIGIGEILSKLFFFKKVLKDIEQHLQNNHYDGVILIDAPELNFRIGRMAHAAKQPVFYYVCPQLWAWRTYRVKDMKKWVDSALVIFPFEQQFFRDNGVPATFVGHPMLDEIVPTGFTDSLRKQYLPAGKSRLVGLLPGSRSSEVNAILTPLLEAADIIHKQNPAAGFVIPVAPHIPLQLVQAAVGKRDYVTVVEGQSHSVMEAAELLITKSGTSTLEAAIFGTPMIIVYKTSFVSYWFAKLLVHVKWAGLPNLIAGKLVAEEFLQYKFKPSAVAKAALQLLSSDKALQTKKQQMEDVRQAIGKGGAAESAALHIKERLGMISKFGSRQGA